MDLVGFSVTYELNVTNVLNMLSLGGVKIRSDERQGNRPDSHRRRPLNAQPETVRTLF